MFKSNIPCKGEGETCNNLYIQNKKYHLCSDCVFKKNHNGESRQEVMSRKMKFKLAKIGVIVSDSMKDSMLKKAMSQASMKSLSKVLISEEQKMFEQNKINQNNVKEIDQKEEDDFMSKESFKSLNEVWGNDKDGKYKALYNGKKKRKSIKKTKKQNEIDIRYKITCDEMDRKQEHQCSGCGRYQGGNIILSHSHVISRKDCKDIGKIELIYSVDNLRYHCLDFAENVGCHRKWENPSQRYLLSDYGYNIAYIKNVAPELIQKYISNEI